LETLGGTASDLQNWRRNMYVPLKRR